LLILPKNKSVLANLAGLRYASVADWNIFVISVKNGNPEKQKTFVWIPNRAENDSRAARQNNHGWRN